MKKLISDVHQMQDKDYISILKAPMVVGYQERQSLNSNFLTNQIPRRLRKGIKYLPWAFFLNHTQYAFFLRSNYRSFHMLMWLFSGPKLVFLFINKLVQNGNFLLIKKKNFHKFRIVLNTFAFHLVKTITVSNVGLSLFLKHLHFVGKKFHIAVNDLLHKSLRDPHLLWQPSTRLAEQLFQQILKVLNTSWDTRCKLWTITGFVIVNQTTSDSKLL